MTAINKTKEARQLPTQNGSLLPTLVPGPFWASFEKFRMQGQKATNEIMPGMVGTLVSQGQQFRILRDADFQRLIGLAREVDRVRGGLRVVLSAVRTVQEHPDESSVDTLVEAALLLGDSPVLPTRHRFAALAPEHEQDDLDSNDEDAVELDPSAVGRPYDLVGTP